MQKKTGFVLFSGTIPPFGLYDTGKPSDIVEGYSSLAVTSTLQYNFGHCREASECKHLADIAKCIRLLYSHGHCLDRHYATQHSFA